jgi:hypothetical protein
MVPATGTQGGAHHDCMISSKGLGLVGFFGPSQEKRAALSFQWPQITWPHLVEHVVAFLCPIFLII